MLRIGITGPPGAGKSKVADVFNRFGADVVSADHLAHQLYEPNGPAYNSLIETFGDSILQKDDAIDRDALRNIVRNDVDGLQRLNAAVHPALVAELRRRLTDAAQREGEAFVLDAALIFEWGIQDALDVIVTVDAPRATRIKRFEGRPGWSREFFDRIEAAQWNPQRKREHADYVVHNVGTREDLDDEAEYLWKEIGQRQPQNSL